MDGREKIKKLLKKLLFLRFGRSNFYYTNKKRLCNCKASTLDWFIPNYA